MNKLEFLSDLDNQLSSLPRSEINKFLAYYAEIIDDRLEDGMTEEEAVCGLGDIEEIAREAILDTTPLPKLIIPSGSLSKLDMVLLFLCSPLILALFALIVVFYAGVWLVILGLFLLNISFVLVGIAGVFASIVDFSNNISFNLLMFLGSLISIAIGIFTFAPVKIVAKKLSNLTTWFMKSIKLRLLRKRLVK